MAEPLQGYNILSKKGPEDSGTVSCEENAMKHILASIVLLVALHAGAAFAQGYTYQPSGLGFTGTVPVEAGESVKGLIQMTTGLIALGDVQVEGVQEDDMFAYWAGKYGGQLYYYDGYSGYWRPGPLSYPHASLLFQGEVIEGRVRKFGLFEDRNHFFGNDGVLYKRINIERNRRRNTNRKRQIVYSYFVNTQTGERSDSDGLPYRVIGDMGVARAVVAEQVEKQEEALALILKENPAFPMWKVQAYELPEEVVVANGDPTKEEINLMQLIETEIGPLSTDDAAK